MQNISKEQKSQELIELAKTNVDIRAIGLYTLGKHKKNNESDDNNKRTNTKSISSKKKEGKEEEDFADAADNATVTA